MYSKRLLKSFARNYAKKIKSVELLGISHNAVYKINCENAFILRITPAHHRDKAALLAELDFLSCLYSNGAHVAAPIPSLSGKMITEYQLKDDTLFIIAFTIADGLSWQQRADMHYFEHIGRELGRIHAISRKYHVTDGTPRRQYSESQHLAKAFAVFEKHNPALYRAYQLFVQQLSLLPQSPMNFGLIHGDFLLTNYNITLGNKVTVFDFDECEYSWFISDIATLLYYHLTGGDPTQTADRMNEAQEALMKVMTGYRMENDLPPEELKQLDLFFRLRDYVLLSTILEKNSLGWWDKKLLPVALDRILNENPFVYIDMDYVIQQLNIK